MSPAVPPCGPKPSCSGQQLNDSLLAKGLWLLAKGLHNYVWLLAKGLWLLAKGIWLLAKGLWLLAKGLMEIKIYIFSNILYVPEKCSIIKNTES